MVFLSAPAVAQNTKGDRAEVSGPRKGRFTGQKRKRSSSKFTFNKRVSPNRFSLAKAARSFSRSRKPSSGKNVYSQKSFWVNNHQRKPSENARQQGAIAYSRKAVKSPANKSRNVYPQSSRYVSNSSRKPKSTQNVVSNRSTLARLNRMQSAPGNKPPGRKKKVIPRSASSSFIRHRTINANAGFWNVRKKGEVAVVTDIAGRPLRTKNYRTPTPGVIKANLPASLKRKRVGDRPYKGAASGRHVSASRPGRAWSGDIAGRRVRGRNYTSKPVIEVTGHTIFERRRIKPGSRDRVYRGRAPGNGYRSASQPGEKRTGILPLPGTPPGFRALSGLAGFRGNLKGRRPQKGGGSRSMFWNNQGQAIQGRSPGVGANRIGTFQGNIKGRRQSKGGGSVSGRLWNNQGQAIQGRTPGIGANRIGTFQGNIKAHRTIKGGGKASGFPGHIKRFQLSPGFNNQGEEFTGYNKTRKPLKGGGSVSGKLWNNKQNSIPVRNQSATAARPGGFPGRIKRFQLSPGFNNQGEEFTGFIRARKPLKGGGSVSGKLWNNQEKPIMKKDPSLQSLKSSVWQGDTKRFEVTPGFNNQGEEFTGFIKLRYFKRNYIRNKNSSEDALKKKHPDKTTYLVKNLQIKVKRRNYIENKNSAEESLKKLSPTDATRAVGNLQVKVKRRNYIENKNSADEALKKLSPTDATKAVGNLQVKVKQYHYIHNSSSAKEALNVREPGKAFARATDYQGNIKMKKIDFNKLFSQRNRELHPDAQFVKIEKNNVASERSLVTNIKLWWAKTFRKNETQPDNLKERERKPRYDKGEQGLWND